MYEYSNDTLSFHINLTVGVLTKLNIDRVERCFFNITVQMVRVEEECAHEQRRLAVHRHVPEARLERLSRHLLVQFIRIAPSAPLLSPFS